MEEKLDFARMLNNLDNNLPKSRGDCFDYGSWYGCDKECPVFKRGECELQEENQKLFNKE